MELKKNNQYSLKVSEEDNDADIVNTTNGVLPHPTNQYINKLTGHNGDNGSKHKAKKKKKKLKDLLKVAIKGFNEHQCC